MDTKSIAALMLKVTGLILVVFSLTQLAGYFPLANAPYRFSIAEVALTMALSLGPLMLVGLVLWFFPGTLTNKIVAATPMETAVVDLRPIEQVALTVLGVYLLTHAIIGGIRDVIFFVMVDRESNGLGKVPVSVIAHSVAIGAEAVIGILLCLGARGASRLIGRLRG